MLLSSSIMCYILLKRAYNDAYNSLQKRDHIPIQVYYSNFVKHERVFSLGTCYINSITDWILVTLVTSIESSLFK